MQDAGLICILSAFAGCMENEFMRVSVGRPYSVDRAEKAHLTSHPQLECDGQYIVPRNGPGVTKYP